MNNFKELHKMFRRYFLLALVIVSSLMLSLFAQSKVSAQQTPPPSPSCEDVCSVAREEGVTEKGDGADSGLCCCLVDGGIMQSKPASLCENLD